jgi:DNA invertase Pin-like site-specific DNA recombinase
VTVKAGPTPSFSRKNALLQKGPNLNLTAWWGNVSLGKVARVVVFDLSRLSRKGVADTIETINALQKMKVDLVSSNDGLDFHGQMGLVMASMLSAFSKIEHDLRAERQRIGIESAKKANGGKCPWGGSQRRRDASHDQSIQKLRETGLTIRKIAETLKISPTTVQKSVKAHKPLKNPPKNSWLTCSFFYLFATHHDTI